MLYVYVVVPVLYKIPNFSRIILTLYHMPARAGVNNNKRSSVNVVYVILCNQWELNHVTICSNRCPLFWCRKTWDPSTKEGYSVKNWSRDLLAPFDIDREG